MFNLQFSTGYDAFVEDGPFSVAKALRQVAADVENGITRGAVMDYNGNTVGQWSLSED